MDRIRALLAKSLFPISLFVVCAGGHAEALFQSPMLDSIIGEIRQLEDARDPKCYATASRLEDFMYGTPLSDEARFRKNELQKMLIRNVWHAAAQIAPPAADALVSASDMETAQGQLLSYRQRSDGQWEIGPAGDPILIKAVDKRHYSSIAYALRALLAVQQEMLLAPQEDALPRLAEGAFEVLKDFVDLYTLAALQLADRRARLENRFELTDTDLEVAWEQLAGGRQRLAAQAAPALGEPEPSEFRVIKGIIEQKIQSYAAYNRVSGPIFLRNLQVYFARVPWPRDEGLSAELKAFYTRAMINFATDLYVGAEAEARRRHHPLIRLEDVKAHAQVFIPHQINAYEDALFFPSLPPAEQVFIESYDMDAFRDSGMHWRYLQAVLEDPGFAGTLEPDPFAAELLVENIAQFGVLALRMAGIVAKREKGGGGAQLLPDHIDKGLRLIQTRINAHGAAKPAERERSLGVIRSSHKGLVKADDMTFFSDVTGEVGIDVEHRTSDWLSRLLRSYLPSGENQGTMTIPPAFGGAGVAAEDIDGDGLADILILSGRGNRLYRNDGAGGFTDISAAAGIDWRRPQDNLPGEPRQPIIADLDNDGLQDILITYVNDAHRVYRNLGDGRFADVTREANLGGAGLVGGPATVFDYDRDGLLDIYIAYFGDYLQGVLPTLQRRNANGLPNRLFRNKGGMRFEDVTADSGLGNTGWGQAVGHTDLDGDGWQDLIVGNDFGVNAYYRNRGDGTFENIAARIGTDKPSYTMNIGLADLNDDDFPDIYISNIVTLNKDEKYVLPNQDTVMKFNPEKLTNLRVVEANDLFISRGGKEGLRYALSDLVERGYSSTGWSWDADFFDFDNDGDDDLYVLNGMNEFAVYGSENPYYRDPLDHSKKPVYIPVAEKESNVFFVNDGGRLQNASRQSGADLLGNSRSAAYLDYDHDGDLDMVLNNYHGAAVFYRNNAERYRGNWLSLKLIGDPAQGVSRDAIGARIVVTAPGGERVWREVHGSIGYMSVHPKEQHVGLGAQTVVSVRVQWPNGTVDKLENLAVNRRYRIDQTQAVRLSTLAP